MTIPGVKSNPVDLLTQGSGARTTAEPTVDFAAVARSVAAGDLDAARQALASAGTPTPGTAQTLAQTLSDGNLAAARLALAQLGAEPFAQPQTTPPPARDVSGGPFLPAQTERDVTIGPNPPPPSPAVSGATSPGNVAGMTVADVGATLSGASGGETVTSANGNSYSVADVLLALATGNAGSIPADVINQYGPGGAHYDPAAIMDAYRNSDIGKTQMAALAWIGRPV